MKTRLLQMISMRDGCRLATDVYMPDGRGSFPVLLTRTPYHRTLRCSPAPLYTDQNYVFVVQDTRGKYASEGERHPLVTEVEDGQDTIEWIAAQKWCNGRIGLVGLSYAGIVQVPAAIGGHEALKCIFPGAAPTSFFRDWIRHDGCYALANTVRWALCGYHDNSPTYPADTHFDWNEVYRKKTLVEIFDLVGFESKLLRTWVEHDRYDDYWRKIDQHNMYSDINCPGMHYGGWFDHHLRGTIGAYRGIRDGGKTLLARTNQRLLIGPWGHDTIEHGARNYGDWNFGSGGQLNYHLAGLRFFNYWLKDEDDGFSNELPIKIFLMGENHWVSISEWPPADMQPLSLYLSSDGTAEMIPSGGKLDLEIPGSVPPDSYTYNPNYPVSTLGGPVYWNIPPSGPVDQRPILPRPDVLVFQGEPLANPLCLMGEINLELWIETDVQDSDFMAKLCVVEKQGKFTCLAVGSIRCRFRDSWSEPKPLKIGVPTRLRIQMGYLAYTYPRDSRIALLITSSSYPRILPHSNTMAPTFSERGVKVAHHTILHDTQHPSHLDLPVITT